MEERLQKFMARAGVGSRRHCEELIRQGRVKVNGNIIRELGTKVNPDTAIIEVDGEQVKPKPDKFYLMLNKPSGFITSVTDKYGRPTVIELLGGLKDRVYPVGRLDLNTEGLLFITNDGELAFRLTHPRYKVKKKYVAEVMGHPSDDIIEKLRKGVMLEDGLTAPAAIKIMRETNTTTFIEISIHEGRKRQIRRMFDQFDHAVVFLKRVSVDGVTLGKLPLGDFRHLTENEIDSLFRSVRLK
jgi:23S rRNA pseudouridine2605 synthase